MSLDYLIPLICILALIMTYLSHKFENGLIFGLLAIFAWIFVLLKLAPDYGFIVPFFIGLIIVNIIIMLKHRRTEE
jgi:hypothetical protein